MVPVRFPELLRGYPEGGERVRRWAELWTILQFRKRKIELLPMVGNPELVSGGQGAWPGYGAYLNDLYSVPEIAAHLEKIDRLLRTQGKISSASDLYRAGNSNRYAGVYRMHDFTGMNGGGAGNPEKLMTAILRFQINHPSVWPFAWRKIDMDLLTALAGTPVLAELPEFDLAVEDASTFSVLRFNVAAETGKNFVQGVAALPAAERTFGMKFLSISCFDPSRRPTPALGRLFDEYADAWLRLPESRKIAVARILHALLRMSGEDLPDLPVKNSRVRASFAEISGRMLERRTVEFLHSKQENVSRWWPLQQTGCELFRYQMTRNPVLAEEILKKLLKIAERTGGTDNLQNQLWNGSYSLAGLRLAKKYGIPVKIQWISDDRAVRLLVEAAPEDPEQTASVFRAFDREFPGILNPRRMLMYLARHGAGLRGSSPIIAKFEDEQDRDPDSMVWRVALWFLGSDEIPMPAEPVKPFLTPRLERDLKKLKAL